MSCHAGLQATDEATNEVGGDRQAPLGGGEEPNDPAAASSGDGDDEHACDYAGGDSDEIAYELEIGPITALTGRLAVCLPPARHGRHLEAPKTDDA